MSSVFKQVRGIAPVRAVARALGLGAAAALALGFGGVALAGELLDVRFGVTAKDKTRIVLDIKGPFEHAVSGDADGQGRLFVDLSDVSLGPQLTKASAGKGHVAKFRVSAQKKGAARVELRFGRTAKITEIFVIEPSASARQHRLVVDLQSAGKDQFLASLPEPKYADIVDVIKDATKPAQRPAEKVAKAPEKKPAQPPAKKAEKPKKAAPNDWPVIVIDAGHGGADPGAVGQNGAKESVVNLAAALKLAELLKKTGRYRVVLTRASDVRMAHEQRIQIARTSGADLFVSIHADAHGDPDLRGGSVYTLSEEGTERSAKEAREQGNYHVYGLDAGELEPVVSGILLDKAQDKTSTNSSRFATILVNNLKGVTPLLNNTHRKGNLKVLLSPDVPAVLLELAFISNAKDEANLISDPWRAKAMAATAKAIDEYFARLEPSRHAANSASGGK